MSLTLTNRLFEITGNITLYTISYKHVRRVTNFQVRLKLKF